MPLLPRASNVTVINKQSDPVPVASIPREPVQRIVSVSFSKQQTSYEKQATLYTVPAGKLLVVEHVGAQGQFYTDIKELVVAVTSWLGYGATGNQAWIPITKHGWFDGRGTMFVGAGLARVYCGALPGNKIYCRIIPNQLVNGNVEVSFSGYLIDA